LSKLFELIEKLPEGERESLLLMAQQYQDALMREQGQKSFMSFVRTMWPGFIHGRHHSVMSKKFEEIAAGKANRLIINMPPRHTKSEFASYLLPAWFLGKYPGKKIIQCSNTAELAVGFGRKVRNLVDGETYAKVFPNVALRHDSKAAGRWSTNEDGEYFAIGVGGTVTGKGADLLIIDDPHSEQEAALAANDPSIYDKVYEWYTSGPRQRLQPGGSIVVVMCMTGDTPVLMADGNEKLLKDIRPGDRVATFDKGRLRTSKINNWQSSGVDSIYQIQTQSGKILRANERHPFLVMNEGVLEWTRLKHLKAGDLLVSLKDAAGHHEQQQNLECVGGACPESRTIEKTQMHRTAHLAVMECGKGSNAHVGNQFTAKDCALNATESNTRRQNKPQSKEGRPALNIGMGSLLSNTIQWFKNATTFVMSAVNPQQATTHGLIGMESCALITATTQDKSEGFFATTATLQLDTERRQMFLSELHRISDFTVDPIASITPDGEEEVFDVEVDRTENFIANGMVSHNTRWGKRDLTGQVLKAAAQRGGEEWEVVEFPAILPSGNPLWPEFWSFEELDALRNELPNSKWQAQYQQNPTSESAAIIKREWWKIWEEEDPPTCNYTLMAWDTAFEKSSRADYSAMTLWGVFEYPDDNGTYQTNIILLNAFRDRMEFPELKKRAIEHYRDWEPDSVIIEKKASGAPLIYEMRAMGIPVQEFTPVRGNDKISRVNAISDLFASGRVWAPPSRWAEEVIDEVASFPSGEHDDYVDTVSLAMMRFRKGGFIKTLLDEEDEPREFRRRNMYAYY
jgi:predicted phage terminase large subunit-like protein